MQPISSYQPYLIGEGKSRTGYFTYLDSWVKPQDAFDTLINAYIYRGSIYQRTGIVPFPSAQGPGALVYQDNFLFATGDGFTRTFTSNVNAPVLTHFPVIADTNFRIVVTSKVSGTIVTATNTTFGPTGTIAGAIGPITGSIVYATGVLTVQYSSAPDAGAAIMVQYSYVPTALTTPINNPIMGIKQFLNETNDTNILVVMDTRRLSWWNPTLKSFVGQQTFQQNLYQFPAPNTSNAPIFNQLSTGNISTQWTNVAPYSVTISDNQTVPNIMRDDGIGPTGHFINVSGADFVTGTGAGSSTITYATGQITVNYKAGHVPADSTLVQVTGATTGDYFSGNNTNFFNAVNWSPAETDNELYMTNNVDFITLFDGTFLSRPAFAVTAASFNPSRASQHATLIAPSTVQLPFVNDIAKTLDIKVYKNRLLMFRPTLVSDFEPHGQGIFFSAINQPLNFVSDISGNGGDVELATGDWIMSVQLLRDGIVVFANNSTWFLRENASPSLPFRVDQINSTKSTNAPYGSTVYDVHATSMGAKGLISCDGVGVERYDINVIDLFEQINQNAFHQCFATRYDSMNVTWMLYPDDSGGLVTSDSVMVYNFLEQTWAIFKHNMGFQVQSPTTPNTLSCLGLGFTTQDLTWGDFAPGKFFGPNGLSWKQATFPWNNSLIQNLAPVLLAGDQNGYVYITYEGSLDNAGPFQGNPIQTSIITKRLNPFSQDGQKARFGYVDIYYEVNPDITITVYFFANNNNNAVASFTFTLDAPDVSDPDLPADKFSWKRFYPNFVGEFIQIGITSENEPDSGEYNLIGTFKILGMILWAAPAGRLTPGNFI